jgi:hypothetical protein
MLGGWPGHNFSVVARSLLIGTINLGLPWDFDDLHVAKISLFATSALTAGKQALYCMRRADLCGIGGNRFNLVLYNSVLVVSPMPVIKPLLLENIFSIRRSMPSAARQSSSVSREVDDSSIQVTSFVTAITVLSRPVTSLSALAHAQRAGAQRLCALARIRRLPPETKREGIQTLDFNSSTSAAPAGQSGCDELRPVHRQGAAGAR